MTMDNVTMSKKIKFSLSKDRKLNFVIMTIDYIAMTKKNKVSPPKG